ncbi:MAG: type 4a pilus biogenesis protein PilO [Gammaproteobacteria bacterium]|nr:type 4a pilus biogenesis protein PilO [Gammaproteobacteria bacterium]
MDIKATIEKLNDLDLSSLDVEDLKKIGSAPMIVKIIVIALICIAVAGAGVWYDTMKQLEALKKAEEEEVTLKQTFDFKQSKAANLDAYSQQLDEMKRSFGALLRQLPNKTEIESLLTDISQTGIASGLEIEYFKPEGLSPKEFYAEFPIKLRVTGRFHQFGKFVSGVAALPRIVTMRNITIQHPKDQKSGVKLVMEVTAVTYQYLDEQEDV